MKTVAGGKIALTIAGNQIQILKEELDIYDAPVLKDKIYSVASVSDSVVIDLKQVEEVSTPVIQVLIAAQKGIRDLKILNIQDGVIRSFKLFGLSI